MNTKEAVEKVSNKYEGWQGYARTQKEVDELGEERDRIIELLKRGEKFEVIFKKFVQFIFNWRYPISHKVMRDKVRELRQKYFPKE